MLFLKKCLSSFTFATVATTPPTDSSTSPSPPSRFNDLVHGALEFARTLANRSLGRSDPICTQPTSSLELSRKQSNSDSSFSTQASSILEEGSRSSSDRSEIEADEEEREERREQEAAGARRQRRASLTVSWVLGDIPEEEEEAKEEDTKGKQAPGAANSDTEERTGYPITPRTYDHLHIYNALAAILPPLQSSSRRVDSTHTAFTWISAPSALPIPVGSGSRSPVEFRLELGGSWS